MTLMNDIDFLLSIVNMLNIISNNKELKQYVLQIDNKMGFFRERDKRNKLLKNLVKNDMHSYSSFCRCLRCCKQLLILESRALDI